MRRASFACSPAPIQRRPCSADVVTDWSNLERRFDVLPKMLDPTWIVRLYREGERNPGGTLQPVRAR